MITYAVLLSIDLILFLITLRQFRMLKKKNSDLKLIYSFIDYEYKTPTGMMCTFLTACIFIFAFIHIAMEGIFFLFGIK